MIRKGTPSDCLDLAALSIQVWLHTYATYGIRKSISNYVLSTFTESYFQKMMNNSSRAVWVFQKDEHLVGYIAVDFASQYKSEDIGYEISTLYVSEHFHNQGIGRQLIEQVEAQYGSPYWLSAWEQNHKAIGFYQKLGFKEIGEINFELEGEQHKNYVLQYSGV